MKALREGFKPFTSKQILRACVGLGLLAALSGCGPTGTLPSDRLSASEEAQIEQEVEQELEQDLLTIYQPTRPMTRTEFRAYVENLRQELTAKKRAERLKQHSSPSPSPTASEATPAGPAVEVISEPNPEPTQTPAPVVTPTATITPVPVVTPSVTATPVPTATPSASPTPRPSVVPTPVPTMVPTSTPTPPPVAETDEEEPTLEPADQSDIIQYRPLTKSGFELASASEELGRLKSSEYLKVQVEAINLKRAACNHFVLTALTESKYFDVELFEYSNAKDFSKKHLTEEKGWKKVDIAQVKAWMKVGKTMDVIYQRPPFKGKAHGHIGVIVGMDRDFKLVAAEGVLDGASNRVLPLTDKYLKNFSLYVRTPEHVAEQQALAAR